ncbi:MAG: LamG-like jellyroll fold domain-containing protein [Planctomycetota bacterium]
MSTHPSHERDQQILELLDGNLPGQEQADLRQWLDASPEHYDRFVELSFISSQLADQLTSQRSANGVRLESIDAMSQVKSLAELALLEAQAEPITVTMLDTSGWKGPGATSKQWQGAAAYLYGHYATPRMIGVAATAAALFLGVIFAIVFLTRGDGTQDLADAPGVLDFTPPPPSPDPNRAVATLTGQVQAEWVTKNGQGAMPDRMLLGVNQRLALTQGFAEITTNRGAKVLLQAPATIETTDSDNAIRLHRGKLVGRCETPSSKGFVVHAPGMDVVDLGTVFGVAADEANGSTVKVMEGSVRVEPAKTSPLAFEPVVLLSNEARRVMPDTGGLEPIALNEVPVFHAVPVHPYVAAVLDAKPALWLRQQQAGNARLLGDARFKRISQGFSYLELDGKGCLDAGDVLDFSSNEPFTISVWVRTDLQNLDMFLLGRIARNESRGFHGYDLYIKQRRLLFQMKNCFLAEGQEDVMLRVDSAEELKDKRWQHLVVAYDGSGRAAGVGMYLDGQPIDSMVQADALNGEPIDADTTFRVGIRGFASPHDKQSGDTAFVDSGSPMKGGVGDLSVYQRVLSQQEIRSIHEHSRDAYLKLNPGP